MHIIRKDEICKKHTKGCSTFSIFLSFLKVGIIGFGGGSSLIPIVEREIVDNRKLMSSDEYIKHTIVANITPGALPVKLGATCGNEIGGIAGAIAGAYGVALPSVLLTLSIASLLMTAGQADIDYINYASVGISVFIVFLLLSYTVKTVHNGNKSLNLLLCGIAFVLTGGKEIHAIAAKLMNADAYGGSPMFDLSTIDLMLVSFFMIFLHSVSRSKTVFSLGLILSGAYSFFAGKAGSKLKLASYAKILLLIMLVWSVCIYCKQRKRNRKNAFGISKDAAVLSGIFIGIPIVILLFAELLGLIDAIDFALKVAASTATSFGGGEAYISVADGIFVHDGYIRSDYFYTRLVPVANALPGPILVKIASGVGFAYGQKDGMLAGLAFALIAMGTSIGICCAIAALFLSIYDNVCYSAFVENLKKYVLPVICGMLLSTSCSLLSEALAITGGKGIHPAVSLSMMLAVIAFLKLLAKKSRLPDIVMLLALAAVSTGILSLNI